MLPSSNVFSSDGTSLNTLENYRARLRLTQVAADELRVVRVSRHGQLQAVRPDGHYLALKQLEVNYGN